MGFLNDNFDVALNTIKNKNKITIWQDVIFEYVNSPPDINDQSKWAIEIKNIN